MIAMKTTRVQIQRDTARLSRRLTWIRWNLWLIFSLPLPLPFGGHADSRGRTKNATLSRSVRHLSARSVTERTRRVLANRNRWLIAAAVVASVTKRSNVDKARTIYNGSITMGHRPITFVLTVRGTRLQTCSGQMAHGQVRRGTTDLLKRRPRGIRLHAGQGWTEAIGDHATTTFCRAGRSLLGNVL